MFFRVKPARGYRYLQIARSIRVEGKVRQEIIATLGRLDVLQESGQLDRLLRSGLRYCRQVKVLDAHAGGESEPVSIIKIGPELVFGRLWQDMGIGELISQLAAERRYGFDLERAVYLTVLRSLPRAATGPPKHGRKTIPSREPRSWPSSISTGPWRGWAKRLERES